MAKYDVNITVNVTIEADSDEEADKIALRLSSLTAASLTSDNNVIGYVNSCFYADEVETEESENEDD